MGAGVEAKFVSVVLTQACRLLHFFSSNHNGFLAHDYALIKLCALEATTNRDGGKKSEVKENC